MTVSLQFLIRISIRIRSRGNGFGFFVIISAVNRFVVRNSVFSRFVVALQFRIGCRRFILVAFLLGRRKFCFTGKATALAALLFLVFFFAPAFFEEIPLSDVDYVFDRRDNAAVLDLYVERICLEL